MARTKLSDELKEAIKGLSDKDKNKYLLRLIAKEALLIDQLTFTILEDGETQLERREAVSENIKKTLEERSKRMRSPRYMLRDVRALSGEITRHLRTTKDTYGELALNFQLLNTTFELMGRQIRKYNYDKTRSFDYYVVRRALKLQKLVEKLHEDYQLDFVDDFRTLEQHFKQHPSIRRIAGELGLDWEN